MGHTGTCDIFIIYPIRYNYYVTTVSDFTLLYLLIHTFLIGNYLPPVFLTLSSFIKVLF